MKKNKLRQIDVPFTQVANEPLNDESISWKAKGIYAYIRSKPDGWDFSAKRMQNDATDGRDGTLSGIKELEDAGYLSRERQADGRVIYTPAHSKKPKPENTEEAIEPKPEKPTVGNAHGGETRPISNKDIQVIKKSSNKDIYNTIFSFWNSREVTTHRKLNSNMKRYIDTLLKDLEEGEIIKSIDNYATIYHSPATYWSHKWTLEEFLSRKNGCRVFVHKSIADYADNTGAVVGMV